MLWELHIVHRLIPTQTPWKSSFPSPVTNHRRHQYKNIVKQVRLARTQHPFDPERGFEHQTSVVIISETNEKMTERAFWRHTMAATHHLLPEPDNDGLKMGQRVFGPKKRATKLVARGVLGGTLEAEGSRAPLGLILVLRGWSMERGNSALPGELEKGWRAPVVRGRRAGAAQKVRI